MGHGTFSCFLRVSFSVREALGNVFGSVLLSPSDLVSVPLRCLASFSVNALSSEPFQRGFPVSLSLSWWLDRTFASLDFG